MRKAGKIFFYSVLTAILSSTDILGQTDSLTKKDSSKTCDCNTLYHEGATEGDGIILYYSKKTKKEFTGTCCFFFENGKKSRQQSFKKGKQSGWEYEWSKNGTLRHKKQYKNGLPLGKEYSFNDDGKLESYGKIKKVRCSSYCNGNNPGFTVVEARGKKFKYNEKGQVIKYTEVIIADEKSMNKKEVEYADDGKPLSVRIWRNGKEHKTVKYYSNGKKQFVHIYNWKKKTIKVIEWDKDGNKKVETNGMRRPLE